VLVSAAAEGQRIRENDAASEERKAIAGDLRRHNLRRAAHHLVHNVGPVRVRAFRDKVNGEKREVGRGEEEASSESAT
jgi:hypothetical protein